VDRRWQVPPPPEVSRTSMGGVRITTGVGNRKARTILGRSQTDGTCHNRQNPLERRKPNIVIATVKAEALAREALSMASHSQFEELENIPSPDAGTPTASMDTDLPQAPVPFVIPTVDDEIDDDEANSSFQELTSWVRYLAQHRGQRRRLLSLTTEVVESLRDLLGEPEGARTATYASVAATSALHPRKPKKATPAQTTCTIQHAITRYERVSKELPGAPRDTLLKAIASSNLKTTPADILNPLLR
jgi:hypothetical protein